MTTDLTQARPPGGDVPPAAAGSLEPGEIARALSTQPAPVAPTATPEPGGPALPARRRGAAARRAWRQLTSMRTALLLLLVLALAAVPGSVLPQRGSAPDAVAAYLGAHRTLGPLFDRLSLFDVFGAPWFAAIYLLLFVSLVGCLVPRIRLHARALRVPPPASVPARFDRLPTWQRWHAPASPAGAGTPSGSVGAAAALLRKRGWRVAMRGQDALVAEKGYLRETGNLLFHVSLLALLVGIGVGAAFGYHGSRVLVEGQSFTSSRGLYDEFTAGALIDPARISPFTLRLDRFAATYLPSGQPKTFDAFVGYTDPGGARPRTDDVRINHPVRAGSLATYLGGHGYAPHVRVADGSGRVLFDDYVVCRPESSAQVAYVCTIKIPDTGLPPVGSPPRPQQLAFTGVFFPSPAASPSLGIVGTSPSATTPGMTVLALTGDLGVDSGVPQSVYQLDTTALTRVATGFLAVGRPGYDTLRGLPHGFTFTVDGYRQWASFEVKQDPGKLATLVAAALAVAGLVLSLRIRRRRLWVRRVPGAGSAPDLIEVGGLARTDGEAWSEEFPRLVAALTGVLPSGPADGPGAGVATGSASGDTGGDTASRSGAAGPPQAG